MLSLQALLSSPEPSDPQDAVVARQYLDDIALFNATCEEEHGTGAPRCELPALGGGANASNATGWGAQYSAPLLRQPFESPCAVYCIQWNTSKKAVGFGPRLISFVPALRDWRWLGSCPPYAGF